MKWRNAGGGHTLTGSGAVSAGAEAEDSSAGADPEEREAFVACPFSKASLNRLASGISIFFCGCSTPPSI